MSDRDEFDVYDFSEFTDKDFEEIDAFIARAHPHSPLNSFPTWKKHFAVTDLVSPIWCEVQYEYNLFGKRDKPFHLRPSTFTAKSGKRIQVHRQVAIANDRRLKRGKSVHKALENELRPEKVNVHVISDEERFGLRLVQLIDGFTQLVSDGITRELPVFTITHAQVVLGVIDEVLRSPISHTTQGQVITSSSSPHKRQRLLPPSSSHCIHGDPYEFRILDYKTRRSSNVPVIQDSLSSRLQLMMYHRMLSSLLHPEVFDFDLLWNRLNLDPKKPFSAQFLKDIVWKQRLLNPTDSTVHLNRLVSLWIVTVQRQRPQFQGISKQLQLVYRRSVSATNLSDKGKHKSPEPRDIEDPLEALVLHEELDLARAIEESLREMGYQDLGQVAHHVAHNVLQVGPSSVGRTSAVWNDLVSPSYTDQSDSTLTWAIQQSLLTCAHDARSEVQQTHTNQATDQSETEAQAQEGTTVDIPPIIGTREFNMDDDELDAHLTDVLQWWLGARPARGVDVGQTNRCFTCEYQDSCEWREKKAEEALTLALAYQHTA